MELLPTYESSKFKCPHCGVVSQQAWFRRGKAGEVANSLIDNAFLDYRARVRDYEQKAIANFVKFAHESVNERMWAFVPKDVAIATCGLCGKATLWVDGKLVFPENIQAPPPNSDMNADIREIYLEAATICSDSPRGASALLRLALQLLLKQLGKSGNNINADIKELVGEGLSPKVQKAADLLRVVGNNAVHPGQIDLNDETAIALKLFHLLNFIADEMLTKPKELDALYSGVLPDQAREHIDARDGSKRGSPDVKQ